MNVGKHYTTAIRNALIDAVGTIVPAGKATKSNKTASHVKMLTNVLAAPNSAPTSATILKDRMCVPVLQDSS